MRGRHRKPSAVPRWLAAAGLGAAGMMFGSLAFASPESVPLAGATASVALPTFTPDPPVEPPMPPPAPVADTSVVPTPHSRAPVETARSVDTTAKRVRKSTAESGRTTTTKPKPTATTTKATTVTTTTPKPTTVQASTTQEKPKMLARSTCGGGSLAGTTPSVSAAGRQIMAATGFSGTVLGRAGRGGSTSDHPSGHALDFMTRDGSAILSYVRSHFGELGATYAIYRRTYYPARGGSKSMEDRGGDTANHFDHVHVSFGAGGGPSC